MTIRRIDTWRITCTSCRHEFHDFAHDSEEMLDRMRKGGWRCEFDSGKGGWVYVCHDCVVKEEHAKAGPWCEGQERLAHEMASIEPNVIIRDGMMYCVTCDKKVMYKPPGVYC